MSKNKLVFHDRQDVDGNWMSQRETYHIPYYNMPDSERTAIRLYEPPDEKQVPRPWQDERNLCKGQDPMKWPGNWKQTLDEQMYLPVETMGNYAIHNTFKNDIDKYSGSLTKKQEDDLFIKAETDDQAKAVLIQEHLGLMYKIAKTQQKKFKRVEFTDMLAASALALTELVSKLIGKERGHRLHTIMHNNIVYAIKNIGKDGIIQVGQMKRQDMLVARKTLKELFLEYMEAPTKEDLLRKLGWGESRYDSTFIARESMRMLKYDGLAENPILEVWDENIGKTREYNLEELTAWALDNVLKPKEADVIAYSYGIIEDKKPRSEISAIIGIAASNVSKTKARAEEKLKEFFISKNITKF